MAEHALRRVRVWWALMAALALAGCATPHGSAHGPGPGKHRRMHTDGMGGWNVIESEVFLFLPYDADHDHKVTKSELAAAVEGIWSEVSKGQATLTLVKLREGLKKFYGVPDFDFNAPSIDPDGDGHVTHEKFATYVTRRFTILDANADGALSPEEFYRKPPPRQPGSMGMSPMDRE